MCVMLMSGAVCQRRAPDPTGQEAEHGGGNGDGKAQAVAGESEGGTTTDSADTTDATGEGGNREEKGRQGTAVHSTYEDQRHSAERSGQPRDGNNGG